MPGAIDVFGAAQPDATVTVTFPPTSSNILPTMRQGELYFKQLTVDNGTTAQLASLKVSGVKNLAGANGEDAVSEITKTAFVPLTPEQFAYDLDGNLTDDARWHYTWDGENRLIAVETSTTAATAGAAKKKLEFNYDGQSRRFAKKVFNWSGSEWVLASSTLFLYDGWNMLAELDALNSNAAVRTYVWGIDLSGSMQGAGGVGGLLFSTLNAQPSTFASAYDGNGNLIGLVDMATGAKSATYEYGAFGETLKADGPAASANPFRFSTKYTDTETGLLYYGHRYYSPNTGFWLSRDPIGEDGGVNLYAYVLNSPNSAIDELGLWQVDIGFAFGVGAKISFGNNDGRWNVSGIGGFGLGWTAGYNPNDLGKNNMQGLAFKAGLRAQGTANLGMLGAGAGVGWTSEHDVKCGNYDNRLFVEGSISLRGIEKGYPGFGKVGGEAGIRQFGNSNDPSSMQIKGYAKSTGYSYSIGVMGIAGYTAGVSW